MTTTTTDLDALTALEQAVPAGPWRVAESTPAWGIRTEGGWELAYASYADSGPKVLEFIAAMRNALPALLDELATLRADNEWHHKTLPKVTDQRNAASVQAEQWEKRYAEMLDQRDAAIQQHTTARAELAKTRAERDAAREERYFARVEVDELRRDMAALTRWADGEEREDVPVDEIHDVLRKPRWYAASPAATAEPAACIAADPDHAGLTCDQYDAALDAEPTAAPKANCRAEHTTVIYPIKQPTTVVCTAHEGKRHVNAFTGFSWLDAEPAAS